jgi:hypothetical protein
MMKILLVLLLTIPFHTLNAAKSTSIGVVAILDGGVWRAPDGDIDKKVPLKRNSPVFEKDTIITGSDGFVKILMNDDTVFDLGETSKFTFEKFKLKTKQDRKAKYNFSYGKMRSIFTIKAKSKKDLQIKTPDVVMGVRGTEILADVFENKGKLTTNIALVSGKLNITVPSIKDVANNFNITPGSMFSSKDFIKKKDFTKSLIKLRPAQITKMASVGIMKKGSFLFDTLNKGRELPVSNAMRKLVKSVERTKGDKEKNRGSKLEGLKLKDQEQGFSPQERKEFKRKLKKKLINKLQKRKLRIFKDRKVKHTGAPAVPTDFSTINNSGSPASNAP